MSRFIRLTLLNGSTLSIQPASISMYRLPDISVGDPPGAQTMIHAGPGWYGVKENIKEIEELTNGR